MPTLVVDLDALRPLLARAELEEAALAAAASRVELAGAGVRMGAPEEALAETEEALRAVRGVCRELELCMPPAASLVKLALRVQAHRVVLASEPRHAGHRPAPLDLRAWSQAVAPAVRTLQEECGLPVAVRVAPHGEAVKAARAAGTAAVELDTSGLADLRGGDRGRALGELADAARLAAKLRLRVSLAGGLTRRGLPEVIGAAQVAERVVVGGAWAWASALLGVDRATRELVAALA